MNREHFAWKSFTCWEIYLDQKLEELQNDELRWEIMSVYQSRSQSTVPEMLIVARRCNGRW